MSGTGPSWGGAPGVPDAVLPIPFVANQLISWKSGEALSAADLNYNFALLFGMALTAMNTANQPTALAIEAHLEQRVGALEYGAQETQQRRMREPAYATAAEVNAMRRQLDALPAPIRRLQDDNDAHTDIEHLLHDRVARLEAKPPPPAAPSVAEHERLKAALIAGQQEIKQLRAEVLQSRADLYRARRALQEKDAPSPQPGVGYLLKRIEDLEHKPTLASQKRLIERIDAIEKMLARR